MPLLPLLQFYGCYTVRDLEHVNLGIKLCHTECKKNDKNLAEILFSIPQNFKVKVERQNYLKSKYTLLKDKKGFFTNLNVFQTVVTLVFVLCKFKNAIRKDTHRPWNTARSGIQLLLIIVGYHVVRIFESIWQTYICRNMHTQVRTCLRKNYACLNTHTFSKFELAY